MEALRQYINQVLGSMGTPHTEHEKGMVEAYCDILNRISSKDKKKRRTAREVFDSCVSRLSDVQLP